MKRANVHLNVVDMHWLQQTIPVTELEIGRTARNRLVCANCKSLIIQLINACYKAKAKSYTKKYHELPIVEWVRIEKKMDWIEFIQLIFYGISDKSE